MEEEFDIFSGATTSEEKRSFRTEKTPIDFSTGFLDEGEEEEEVYFGSGSLVKEKSPRKPSSRKKRKPFGFLRKLWTPKLKKLYLRLLGFVLIVLLIRALFQTGFVV